MNPVQFLAELILIVTALWLSRSLPATPHRRFVLGFALLACVTNALFYSVAVVPLYQAKGLARGAIITSVVYESLRWGLLALVLGRFAIRLQQQGLTSGFTMLHSEPRYARSLGTGTAAGVLAALVVYAQAFAERQLGLLDTLPFPVANGEPVNVVFTVGGGLRNLVGEEVFARLGLQALALYCCRGLRGGPVLAIILSALGFELWHNPLQTPLFLNFSVSCVLGWSYHKHGYESAAVGHCVTDWLILGVLPSLAFGAA